MAQFCLTDPIPDFNSAYNLLIGNITWPPKLDLAFPMLPTLPVPMFNDFRYPPAEIVLTALEMQSWQMMTTFVGMGDPMMGVIGGALEDRLPTIPGLGVNLIDILDMNPRALVDAVGGLISGGSFSTPYLSLPLTDIEIPELSAIIATGTLVKNYMNILPDFIVGLIGEVTDELEISNMTYSLTMPTANQVLDLLVGLAGAGSVDDLIRKVQQGLDIVELFSFFSLPPFPSITFSNPMIPTTRMPVLEFRLMLGALVNLFSTYGMGLIMSFIVNTLSDYISFDFPLVCLDL